MPTTLYGIGNCDTIAKARKWMEQRSIAYNFHDYKKAGITQEKLSDWCILLGWEVVLNKGGTTFKKLPEANKQNIDDNKAIMLMMENPSMIKRPILEHGDEILVGFKSGEYEALLIEG